MRFAAFGSESSETSSSSRTAREARRKKHLKRQAETENGIREARKDRKTSDEYPTTRATRTKHAKAYTSGGRRPPQETPPCLAVRGIRWFLNSFIPDAFLSDWGTGDADHVMPGSFPEDDPIDAMDVDSGPMNSDTRHPLHEDDELEPFWLRFETAHPSVILEEELRRKRTQKRRDQREANKDTRRFYPVDPPVRYSSLAQQGHSKNAKSTRDSAGSSTKRSESPLSDTDAKIREEERQKRAREEEERKQDEYMEQLRREIREDEKRGALYNLDVRLQKRDILIKMSIPNHKSQVAFLWEDPAYRKFCDEVFRARYQRRDSRPSSRVRAGYSGVRAGSSASPMFGVHCSNPPKPKMAQKTKQAAHNKSHEAERNNVSSPDVEMSDASAPSSEPFTPTDSDVHTASSSNPANRQSSFQTGFKATTSAKHADTGASTSHSHHFRSSKDGAHEPNKPNYSRSRPGRMAEERCHERPSAGPEQHASNHQTRAGFANGQDGTAKTGQTTTNEQTNLGNNAETKPESGPMPGPKQGPMQEPAQESKPEPKQESRQEPKLEPKPEPKAKAKVGGEDMKPSTTGAAKTSTRRPRPGRELWRHACHVIYDDDKDPWPELYRLLEQQQQQQGGGQTNTWQFECQWLACKTYLEQIKSKHEATKRSADEARDRMDQSEYYASLFIQRARVYFREFDEWLHKVKPREEELKKCEPKTFAFHKLDLTTRDMDRVVAYFEWYEAEWTDISSPRFSESLTFDSIPWPFIRIPRSVSDVTTNSVKAFMKQCHEKSILCSSKIPPFDKRKMTSKQKHAAAKRELMRWHPDKFDTRVLLRIEDENERERVKEAAGVIQRAFTEFMNEPDSEDLRAELLEAGVCERRFPSWC